MWLWRRIKQAGRRLRMADGNHLITCRMYDGWAAVRNGFMASWPGTATMCPFYWLPPFFIWLVFLFPWIWLAVTGSTWAWVLVLVSVGVRLGTAVFTHINAPSTPSSCPSPSSSSLALPPNPSGGIITVARNGKDEQPMEISKLLTKYRITDNQL
ncbi:MAG: hypothetical protein R3E31_05550 [Chloroflexota bacterium]